MHAKHYGWVALMGLALTGCETFGGGGGCGPSGEGCPPEGPATVPSRSSTPAQAATVDAQVYVDALRRVLQDPRVVSEMQSYRASCPANAMQCQAPRAVIPSAMAGVSFIGLGPQVRPPVAVCVSFEATGGRPDDALRARLDTHGSNGQVCRPIAHSQAELLQAIAE